MYCRAACLRACGNCVNFYRVRSAVKSGNKRNRDRKKCDGKNVTEELPESEAEQEYLSDVQGLLPERSWRKRSLIRTDGQTIL